MRIVSRAMGDDYRLKNGRQVLIRKTLTCNGLTFSYQSN
jgi:hypothetical protein